MRRRPRLRILIFFCRRQKKSSRGNARAFDSKEKNDERGSALDLLVERAAAKARVILHFFDFGLHRLFIARRHVAGRIFAFLARFGAFDDNGFSRHDVLLF